MDINEQFEDLLINESAEAQLSAEEVDELLHGVDLLELDPHENDLEFIDVLYKGTEELFEDEANEARVLTIQQRMKKRQQFKAKSSRMQRMRKLKSKRMAPQDRLVYRSRSAALMALRKRLAGAKGMKYHSLSLSQRQNIDTQVKQRYGKKLDKLVGAMAKRTMPLVRKKEMQRLTRARAKPMNESTPKENNSAIAALLRKKVVSKDGDVETYNDHDSDNDNSQQQDPMKVSSHSQQPNKELLNITAVGKRAKYFNKVIESHEDNETLLTPKVNLLMRLGLVEPDEIEKYRRALKNGEKSMGSPELRNTILSMLDKILKLATEDPQTYSRIRNLVNKQRQDRNESKIIESLQLKARQNNVSFDIVKQVYDRGLTESDDVQLAFDRVNSFLAGGDVDEDLYESLKTACWKGYQAIGMKKKNGKKVPNCVPESVSTLELLAKKERAAGEKKRGKSTTAADHKRIAALLGGSKNLTPYESAQKDAAQDESVEFTLEDEVNEVLSKDAKAGDWIHDFVNSKNPKFAGKSPEKRKQMALAAYYAKQKNESLVIEDHYKAADTHLSYANDADAKGDKVAYHTHMADHHDEMSQWHESKGRSASADKHAEKADFHAEKAAQHATRSVKEERHRVSATVSNPTHSSVWERIKKENKTVKVGATSKEEAVKKVTDHYEKSGYKVHDAKPIEERIQRTADVKMIKHTMQNGKTVWRREHVKTKVQHELPKAIDKDQNGRIDSQEEVSMTRSGGGQIGTCELTAQYCSDTPGQEGKIEMAKYSAPVPMVNKEDENTNTGKSERLYDTIRKAISGQRMTEGFVAGIPDAPTAVELGMKMSGSFSHHPSVVESACNKTDSTKNCGVHGMNDCSEKK